VFESEGSVSSVPVENTPFLGKPAKLISVQNKLFIYDSRSDTLVTVFDLNENKVITKIVPKGIGPNEALPPLIISIMADDTLLTFDKGKFQLSYYSFKDSFNIHEKNNFLFQVPTQVSQLVHIRNSRYLAAGYFEWGRYAILNAKGEIEKELGSFPDFLAGEDDMPNDAKAMFHQVRFENNRNMKKIACLSHHVLEIVDYSDSIYVSGRIQLDGYDYKFSTGEILYANETEDTSIGAIDVTSTDQYIYVLFEYAKNRTSESENDIWVFDWTGAPVKKIKVDRDTYLITAVNDNLLYAVVLIEEDFNIVKLNIQ
jgi:hypothetical protein